MSNKTNIGLVEYVKAQLGKPYWWGCFGQLSTITLLAQKRKQYPRHYTAKDFDQQLGVKVHDCIGLIKAYFWCDNPGDNRPQYRTNGMEDVSADMLFNLCKRKGTNMDEMPRVPGIAVFMAGHVGIYIGGCEVIEARGHAYGVVKTKLCQRKWTKWAYIEGLEYLDEK